MLSQFLGEFFTHPAALDYSGNTCSNNCAYCFASLRTETRTANPKHLWDRCTRQNIRPGRKPSMTDWFFDRGYAICVSNRSDPFAASNLADTPIVLQALDMVPNGVFFQTKGMARGWDVSMLDGFRKRNVMMYITISTLDEGISRRVEPGAPLPQARVELARYAKSRGWGVEIGINPCHKAWLPMKDIERLMETMDEIGVRQFYAQPLSLREKEYEVMPDARRNRMPRSEIENAFVRYGDWEYVLGVMRLMNQHGFDCFVNGTPLISPLMDDECKVLGKCVNPVQRFNNWAHRELIAGRQKVFRFGDFIRVMFDGNPDMAELENRTLYQYCMNGSRDEWRANRLAKTAKTFTDVYRVCWNTRRFGASPQNSLGFAVILDDDGRPVRDEYGDKLIYDLWDDPAHQENVTECDGTVRASDLRRKGVEV